MKTSVILLQSICDEQKAEDRQRLADIYTPLVEKWLRRAEVAENDILDICQIVISSALLDLKNFQHSGQDGEFRNWLRNITVDVCRQYRQKNPMLYDAASGSKVDRLLDRLADADTDLTKRWNFEHDKHIFKTILDQLTEEFNQQSMHAFHELVINQETAIKTANDLDLTVREVLALSAAVLKRVLQEASAIISNATQD